MIEIRLETGRYKLTIEGHAQPEETADYKEVCAAVSVLGQSLAYSINKFEKEHEAIEGMDYRGDPGDFLMQAYPSDWAEAFVRKQLKAYGNGLEFVAMTYPMSVHMIWDGEEIKPFTEEGRKHEQETAAT